MGDIATLESEIKDYKLQVSTTLSIITAANASM